jgi:hypothetical protein
MAHLAATLREAGITDDRLSGLIEWPPEEIAFFEDLVGLDRLQAFIVKRVMIALGRQRDGVAV